MELHKRQLIKWFHITAESRRDSTDRKKYFGVINRRAIRTLTGRCELWSLSDPSSPNLTKLYQRSKHLPSRSRIVSGKMLRTPYRKALSPAITVCVWRIWSSNRTLLNIRAPVPRHIFSLTVSRQHAWRMYASWTPAVMHYPNTEQSL